MTRCTSMTAITPSPGRPVWAAFWITATNASVLLDGALPEVRLQDEAAGRHQLFTLF